MPINKEKSILMKLFIVIMAVSLSLTACKSQKEKKDEGAEVNGNAELTLLSIGDDDLLDSIQKQTFNYFWEGAEPNSGMAPERIHMDEVSSSGGDSLIVTTGGTGFGLMAILVGVGRGFISRDQALERYEKIVSFLEKSDRFHGAWPHWLNGTTGKVVPFSSKDDGGDLVETAFLIQGLLTVKEYLKTNDKREKQLAERIQKLWEDVEWNWYTKGENVLYWHWSPKFNWEMDFPVGGYNECLVMYVLAASSPTHPVSKEVYEQGWARNGNIKSEAKLYNLETVLDHYVHDESPVGPLFWAHYSYLGLNPHKLKDQYGDYWKLNKNHALIHYRHSISNPSNYEGYGDECWGLTSSYSIEGYAAHKPDNDLGVISPTAALSSMPYTPEESMKFLRFMYEKQDSLIGKYGPYDAFSFEHKWYLPRYLAIDQGPIPVMIENHRTGLLWDLFMKNEEVLSGLKKLGFTSPYIQEDE